MKKSIAVLAVLGYTNAQDAVADEYTYGSSYEPNNYSSYASDYYGSYYPSDYDSSYYPTYAYDSFSYYPTYAYDSFSYYPTYDNGSYNDYSYGSYYDGSYYGSYSPSSYGSYYYGGYYDSYSYQPDSYSYTPAKVFEVETDYMRPSSDLKPYTIEHNVKSQYSVPSIDFSSQYSYSYEQISSYVEYNGDQNTNWSTTKVDMTTSSLGSNDKQSFDRIVTTQRPYYDQNGQISYTATRMKATFSYKSSTDYSTRSSDRELARDGAFDLVGSRSYSYNGNSYSYYGSQYDYNSWSYQNGYYSSYTGSYYPYADYYSSYSYTPSSYDSNGYYSSYFASYYPYEDYYNSYSYTPSYASEYYNSYNDNYYPYPGTTDSLVNLREKMDIPSTPGTSVDLTLATMAAATIGLITFTTYKCSQASKRNQIDNFVQSDPSENLV